VKQFLAFQYLREDRRTSFDSVARMASGLSDKLAALKRHCSGVYSQRMYYESLPRDAL